MKSDSVANTHDEIQGRAARKRARTRAKLLLSARKVFAKRGYHDASIAEITELADVGVGTFYLHFRDKDEAFQTLLNEGLQEMRAAVFAAIEGHSPAHSLPVIIRTIFRQAFARRDLFQIMLSEGGQIMRTFRVQAGMAEELTQALEKARQQGLLSHYDVPLLARFLTGMVTQGIVWWFENDEPAPDVMAEQVLRLLRDGLPAQLLVEEET
ncbi:MAG TPA: TetR/AcrR family transcriptional regulator [Ktedonobacteraceae bacterium]|nr:TetR/AcrR family transcriptional regulator [Ktedonobacteraceae bacterium]